MKCKAKTKSGSPCSMKALKGQPYCFTHDPSNGAARAKARQLGGARTRVQHAGNAETIPREIKSLADLQKVFDYTLAEVIPMENSIPRGRLLLALIDTGVKLFQVGEMENRIAAVEAALKVRK